MIIKITIALEKSELPVDYSPSFVSLLKNALSKYNDTLFKRYYADNNFSEKNFCFAVKLKNPCFKTDRILLDDNTLILRIHIANLADGIDFYNAFIKQRGIKYPLPDKNSAEIVHVEIANHKQINSDEILIKFLSPLLVRRHENNKDTYLAFNDEDFEKYFLLSISTMLKNLYSIDTDIINLTIEPIEPRKTVVNTFGCKITGNIGVFRLYGDSQVLSILSQTGIGSRRSQGFGCFEVLQEVT